MDKLDLHITPHQKYEGLLNVADKASATRMFEIYVDHAMRRHGLSRSIAEIYERQQIRAFARLEFSEEVCARIDRLFELEASQDAPAASTEVADLTVSSKLKALRDVLEETEREFLLSEALTATLYLRISKLFD